MCQVLEYECPQPNCLSCWTKVIEPCDNAVKTGYIWPHCPAGYLLNPVEPIKVLCYSCFLPLLNTSTNAAKASNRFPPFWLPPVGREQYEVAGTGMKGYERARDMYLGSGWGRNSGEGVSAAAVGVARSDRGYNQMYSHPHPHNHQTTAAGNGSEWVVLEKDAATGEKTLYNMSALRHGTTRARGNHDPRVQNHYHRMGAVEKWVKDLPEVVDGFEKWDEMEVEAEVVEVESLLCSQGIKW